MQKRESSAVIRDEGKVETSGRTPKTVNALPRDCSDRVRRRSDRRGRTPTWSASSVRSGATARSCNSGERDGASSHAHRVRHVLHALANPSRPRQGDAEPAPSHTVVIRSHCRHSGSRRPASPLRPRCRITAVGACRPTIIPAALPRCRSNPLTRVMNPNRGVALCEPCHAVELAGSRTHIDCGCTASQATVNLMRPRRTSIFQ